jgi:hypothetical protein
MVNEFKVILKKIWVIIAAIVMITILFIPLLNLLGFTLITISDIIFYIIALIVVLFVTHHFIFNEK